MNPRDSAENQTPLAVLRRLLVSRADLEAAGETRISVGDTGGLPFTVAAPHQLVLSADTMANADVAHHIRHGLELAWMRALAPHRPVLCGILAARVAALHRMTDAGAKTSEADEALLASSPKGDALAALWQRLAPLQDSAAALASADLRDLADAWTLAAPTEYLVSAGDDPRLVLDPVTGLNRYGCKPRPQPDVVTFSSCTASSTSERGYGSAEASRRRMLGAALAGMSAARAIHLEHERLRAEVLAFFDLTDVAALALAPSGTDATLMATRMVASQCGDLPLTAILMGLSETGNAIPEAAVGQHFAHAADRGFGPDIGLLSVPLRGPGGMPRAPADVESEILKWVIAALDKGAAVLHPVDVSKTGLIAPRPEFVARLAEDCPEHLHVVVDACQARIGSRQLRWYLEAGCSVVVTGSKFYTGPPFSGAVLVPRGKYRLPESDPDVGALLRWAGALGEMHAFAALPADDRVRILRRFGERIRTRIAANPRLVGFPTARPARPRSDGWDAEETIFVFGVRDPAAPERLLDFATLSQIQRWLYSDLSGRLPERVAARVCRLGQPVRLGEAQDAVAALRIAGGARVVSGEPSHVLKRGESHIDRELADLDDVMAKLDLILNRLPELLGGRLGIAE